MHYVPVKSIAFSYSWVIVFQIFRTKESLYNLYTLKHLLKAKALLQVNCVKRIDYLEQQKGKARRKTIPQVAKAFREQKCCQLGTWMNTEKT